MIYPFIFWATIFFIEDDPDLRSEFEKELAEQGEIVEVLYLDKDFNIVPG